MKHSESDGRKEPAAISLYEPMFFWIFILYLALTVKIVLSNLEGFTSLSVVYSILYVFSSFILSTPGFIVMPLIAGGIIGAEVGVKSKEIGHAIRNSLLNSAYAAAIYLVSIVVLYEVLDYTYPSTSLQLQNIIIGWIIIPIVILVVITCAFSVLSNARKIRD